MSEDARALGNIADPQAPHDDLTFAELALRYNHRVTSDRRRVLVRLLMKELQGRGRPRRALDVGCGNGISESFPSNVEYLRVIREQVDELWGVEPDESMEPSHGLLSHFQHATLETAELPENYFDVVYSYFVVEHVKDPAAFMAAAYRCLKPGGVHLFITPNARHYFTMIAKTLKWLRLDELVLRATVGASAADYHYPVQYKCNHPRRITAAASAAGFKSVEFAFIEGQGPIYYFPKPFRFLYHMAELKRRVIRSRSCLLELLCRMTKAADQKTALCGGAPADVYCGSDGREGLS